MNYRVTLTNGTQSEILHSYRPSDPKISQAKITEAVNEIPSFSFRILPDNPAYNPVEAGVSTVAVTDLDRDVTLFEGRCLSVSDGMNTAGLFAKTAVFEGELGYLCDSVQPEGEVSQGTINRSVLSDIIAEHNAQSSQKFALGNVEMAGFPEGSAYDWGVTFDVLRALFVDTLGGEIRLRKVGDTRCIDYAQEFAIEKDMPIYCGGNMREITCAADVSGLITRLYPLGAVRQSTGSRLTIIPSGMAGGKSYIERADLVAKYGVRSGVAIYDVHGDGDTLVRGSTTLYRRGMNTLNAIAIGQRQYKVSALDVSAGYELYGVHQVKNDIMGIDERLRIIGRTIDLDRPSNSTLTFGSKAATLSSAVAQYKGVMR